MASSSWCLFCIIIVVLEIYSQTIQTLTTNQVTDDSGGFQWDNCGIPNTPLIVESFKITPHPVQTNKLFIISASVNVTRDIGHIGQHLMLDGSVKIKIGDEYMEVCDLLDEYCHIENLCSFLEKSKSHCPKSLIEQGQNCTCPFLAGRYEIEKFAAPPNVGFEIHGSFELAIAIKDYTSFQGCINVKFCVNRCSP